MKLIVLSSEEQEINEILCLEQMFRAGLERFHLRKPGWSRQQLRELISRIPNEFLDRVVLHDHYSLLNEFELMGAHFNARNEDEWHLVPGDVHRSISCHSLKELAQLHPNNFQDAFFSPVFPSISKEGYEPSFSKEEIIATVQKCPIPVMALGGITPESMEQCEEMGFGGAAVLGYVWQAVDPYEAYHKLYNACQKKAELPY